MCRILSHTVLEERCPNQLAGTRVGRPPAGGGLGYKKSIPRLTALAAAHCRAACSPAGRGVPCLPYNTCCSMPQGSASTFRQGSVGLSAQLLQLGLMHCLPYSTCCSMPQGSVSTFRQGSVGLRALS